ncbi:hypothetical protein SDC9_172730 [bioreactor metagenome]|uniref:Uncharacterized protein n=1 Tax=bioreactor metagenome TaxID=1076179 RepID=A0A645GH61_9ZZZZ
MPRHLIARDGDDVGALFLHALGDFRRGRFVDQLDAVVFNVGDELGGVRARRFNGGHAFLDAYVYVAENLLAPGKVGHQGDIHDKGLVCEPLHLLYGRPKLLRICVTGDIQRADAPRVAHHRGKLGHAQVLHPALYNGISNAEQFRKSCLHRAALLSYCLG